MSSTVLDDPLEDPMAAIVLRFEPVEQLVPLVPNPPLLGFEVLGGHRDGGGYARLAALARAASLDPATLDVAIFARGLRTAKRLRERTLARIGAEARRLWFSLNVNQRMLDSSELWQTLREELDRDLAAHVHIELSEDYPEGLAGERDPNVRLAILRSARASLERLVHDHSVALVLDDSNELDPVVRATARPLVAKTKADSAFTRRLLVDARAIGVEANHYLAELARHRFGDRPYVIEGIETREEREFLRLNWRGKGEPTAIQGWGITVPAWLDEVFRPCHSAEQPRGYLLQDRALAEIA